MLNKKSQTMNFIVIRIIIISTLLIIAVFAYFGLLDMRTYPPSICDVPPGLICNNLLIDGENDEISFLIKSIMKENLDPFVIEIKGDCDGSAEAVDGLNDGEEEKIIVKCTKDVKGERFREKTIIKYKKENGLSKEVNGSISARIE